VFVGHYDGAMTSSHPLSTVELTPPYLLFVGEESSPVYAKTAAGLAQWRPELCLGQISLTGGTVDLGLPTMTVAEAAEAGAKTLIIGTAPVGGAIPDRWLDVLVDALERGLDIAAGVHKKLIDTPRLRDTAHMTGQKLIDVRVPPTDLPVGTGVKRSGKRLLTVGTDCALGKKYTALALEKEMATRGFQVDFRATGQTGIMIAGRGIPIDAVVADFVSGAAEVLSPDAADDHWDVIEGQGSIFHPGFAAVSMGLLYGSQPDAFVVCHEAGRTHIKGWDGFSLPSLDQVIERTTQIGQQVNPGIHCVGISVNTSTLASPDERRAYLAELKARHGLPAVDPLLTGVGAIVDLIEVSQ
jgi:uncharacterized NAD-dependent epimerase/dehydratase family protein